MVVDDVEGKYATAVEMCIEYYILFYTYNKFNVSFTCFLRAFYALSF
jgi:hypothetical protein